MVADTAAVACTSSQWLAVPQMGGFFITCHHIHDRKKETGRRGGGEDRSSSWQVLGALKGGGREEETGF